MYQQNEESLRNERHHPPTSQCFGTDMVYCIYLVEIYNSEITLFTKTKAYLYHLADFGYPVRLVMLSLWFSCPFGYPVPLVILSLWLSCPFGFPVPLVFLSLWLSCPFGYPVPLVILSLWFSCPFGYPVPLVILSLWFSCFQRLLNYLVFQSFSL